MQRNSRIAIVAVALLLAACQGKTTDRKEVEDLEDRVTELEDQNRLLRDQLEEAKSAAQKTDTQEMAAAAPAPIESPRDPEESSDEPRPHAPRQDGSSHDATAAVARAAAEAAEDAEYAAKPD